MKKLFLILVVLITSSAYSQKEDGPIVPPGFKVNASDAMKGDSANRTVTFYGNVDFESEKLKIKANELFLDKKTNSIVVTGIKDMYFNGKVVFAKQSKNAKLKYTIGDSMLFIE